MASVLGRSVGRSLLSPVLVGSTSVGLYKAITEGPEWLVNGVRAVLTSSLSSLPTAADAAATAAAESARIQAAALAASLKTIEALLSSQKGPGMGSVLLWLAAPLAGALALHHFGWARLGWVSLEQLQEGLASVQQVVSGAITEMSDQLLARFQRIEEQIADTAQSVQEVPSRGLHAHNHHPARLPSRRLVPGLTHRDVPLRWARRPRSSRLRSLPSATRLWPSRSVWSPSRRTPRQRRKGSRCCVS